MKPEKGELKKSAVCAGTGSTLGVKIYALNGVPVVAPVLPPVAEGFKLKSCCLRSKTTF